MKIIGNQMIKLETQNSKKNGNQLSNGPSRRQVSNVRVLIDLRELFN
jgi:hypothetical protein